MNCSTIYLKAKRQCDSVDQRLWPNGYRQTHSHTHANKSTTSHLWSFSNSFLLEFRRRIELDMFSCFTENPAALMWLKWYLTVFLSVPVSPLKGVNVLPFFHWAGFSQSLSLSVPLTPFLCLSPCVFIQSFETLAPVFSSSLFQSAES